MKAQHTQAPWKWDGSKLIGNANQNVWFTLPDLRTNPSEVQANAKLIAAAPEMLEMLKELVKALDKKPLSWDEMAYLVDAKNLIEKVTL
jgi:type II secretory pathway component GspD/PulD (secretin)|tara:strand:+ start:731 stop:997 length:267 start_codon:yes stop_codon:yes gene_type:complete